MSDAKNVKDFGAAGDGIKDDAPAFQRALDAGGKITVPAGNYKIGKTLFIGSDTGIFADPDALIRLADNTSKKRGDFLITNKSNDGGLDSNIVISGGTWDGNNKTNRKPENLFEEDGCSGAIMNFKNVCGLTLSGLTLKDAGGYYTRFCRVKDFVIEDILFRCMNHAPNNDGFHFGGFTENGVIRNIHADTPLTTGDDLIALNADEATDRCEARDLDNGYIKNIEIDGLHVISCMTFVRMLSVDSEISNIKISNLTGGFTCMAINMDGSRNCMVTLVPPESERFTKGYGNIENVTVEHLRVHTLSPDGYFAYFDLETNAKNFKIIDFVREDELENDHSANTALIRNISPSHIKINGKDAGDGKESSDFTIGYGEEFILPRGSFDSLEINPQE